MSEPETASSSHSSAPVSSSGGLVLGLTGDPVQHSAVAKAFHYQWGRVEKLKAQLAELQALQLTFLPLFDRTLGPLQVRQRESQRKTVLWINLRLQRKGLSPTQRRVAIEFLCDLARQLADAQVPGMAELHDQYSRESLAQISRNEWNLLKDLVQEVTGQAPADDWDREQAERFMRAHAARRHQIQQDKRIAREEAQAQKQSKKKKSPAALQAEQLQQDAASLLRQIFRQLASSLHPDRETDEALRLQKTALMSQANTAYDRKDLVALMHLQVQAALVTPDMRRPLADDRLAAFTVLLKQQVADLERERAQKQQGLMHELNLPPGLRLTSTEVMRYLQDLETQLCTLLETNEEERADWERNDAAFKRWLFQIA